MQIDSAILKQACDDIAALDLTAETAQIAAIKLEIAEHEGAIAAGQTRINELGEARRARQSHEDDGSATADALLAKVSPQEAAALMPTFEQIDEEQQRLNYAVRDLRSRIRDRERAIEAVKESARERARSLIEPIADEIFAKAQAAIMTIFESLDCLNALNEVKNVPHVAVLERATQALFENHIVPGAAIVGAESLGDLRAAIREKNLAFVSDERRRLWENERERATMSEQERRGRTLSSLVDVMRKPKNFVGLGASLSGSVFSE